MSKTATVAIAVVLLANVCLCGCPGPTNPVETDPDQSITVQVGGTFEIVTLWDGTHLTAADESVVDVSYDEGIVTLTEERSQPRRSFGMGGLNLFYDIATFRAAASGDTEITLYVPDTAWRDEVLTDRNQPVTFRIVVEP